MNKTLVKDIRSDFDKLIKNYDKICNDYNNKKISIKDIDPIYFTDELIAISIIQGDFYKLSYQYIYNPINIAHAFNITYIRDQSETEWIENLTISPELSHILIEMISLTMKSNNSTFRQKYYEGYFSEIVKKYSNKFISISYEVDWWPLAILKNPTVPYLLLQAIEKLLICMSTTVQYFPNLNSEEMDIYMKKIKNHPNYSISKMILDNISPKEAENNV